MKLGLYTAIYGDYEASAKPLPADLGIPAVMFTDNWDLYHQSQTVGWHAVYSELPYGEFFADPRNGDHDVVTPMLAHKYWKTHPAEAFANVADLRFADVDTSIWIDGNMQIAMPGAEWVARNVAALGDDDWSLMRHPWRTTVRDEHAYTAAVCWGRYSVEAMQRLANALFDPPTAFADNVGLFASGHMVRRHTPEVSVTCEDWWAMNVAFTHQDQLSLPFVIQKHSPKYNANLPWGLFGELHPHGA